MIKNILSIMIFIVLFSLTFISAQPPNLLDRTIGLPSLDTASLFNNTYYVNYSITTGLINSSYLLDSGDTATGNYTFDTTTLFIDSNNNRIGIGKITPITPLHITANPVTIRLDTTLTDWQIDVNSQVAGAFVIRDISNARNVLTLTNAGDVGIGTQTPQNTLNVVGGLNATQNSFFGKNVTITGTLIGGSPVKVSGGLRLLDAPSDTCDSSLRGTLRFTESALGVADLLEVCAKSSLNIYAWKAVSLI